MKKSRFTEEQIAFALRQAEGGAAVRDVCQTFYRWKKKLDGKRLLPLVQLGPRVLAAALKGALPPRMTLDDLLQAAKVTNWDQQARQLALASASK